MTRSPRARSVLNSKERNPPREEPSVPAPQPSGKSHQWVTWGKSRGLRDGMVIIPSPGECHHPAEFGGGWRGRGLARCLACTAPMWKAALLQPTWHQRQASSSSHTYACTFPLNCPGLSNNLPWSISALRDPRQAKGAGQRPLQVSP